MDVNALIKELDKITQQPGIETFKEGGGDNLKVYACVIKTDGKRGKREFHVGVIYEGKEEYENFGETQPFYSVSLAGDVWRLDKILDPSVLYVEHLNNCEILPDWSKIALNGLNFSDYWYPNYEETIYLPVPERFKGKMENLADMFFEYLKKLSLGENVKEERKELEKAIRDNVMEILFSLRLEDLPPELYEGERERESMGRRDFQNTSSLYLKDVSVVSISKMSQKKEEIENEDDERDGRINVVLIF